MNILLPNETGYGILVENDAGYINPNDSHNKDAFKSLNRLSNGDRIIEDPLIVFAILQKCNTQNKNGRVYPQHILKREADKYNNSIKDNSSLGESDHPASSIITIDNVSHSICKMWWQGDTLVGEIEILMTPGFVNYGIASTKGDRIANLIRKGKKIGVSSRGVGSVKEENGNNVVQDDYDLICWDIVTQPSTPGSYIFRDERDAKPYMESVVKQLPINESDLKTHLNKFLNIL